MALIVRVQTLKTISFEQLVSNLVLWITGIAVLQNTKETYWLKQIQIKDLAFQKSPFVIIHYEHPAPHNQNRPTFILKNVGKGVARNVVWYIPGHERPTLPPDIGPHGIEIKSPNFGNPYTSKTVIAPDSGHTRISSRVFEQFAPRSMKYEVVITYENADGKKYQTRLRSGKMVDDFEVLSYGEVKWSTIK